MNDKVEYIGDGAYVRAIPDGSVELMANDHINPTDTVYLEPQVIKALMHFLIKHKLIDLSSFSSL